MGIIQWFLKPLEDYQKQKALSDLGLNILNSQAPSEPQAPSNLVVSHSPLPNSATFRPTSFKEYIGQNRAKTLLQSYINEIKKRNIAFPHLLIHGPAGCGKTTLAKIMSTQLGTKFTEVISSQVEYDLELIEMIEELDGGILFLDEVHGIERDFCEPLYPVMEDFTFNDEKLKPFTMIGATTEVGEIIKNRRPFYDRFKIKIELEDYSTSDLRLIIKQYKDKTFPNDTLDAKVYDIISRNSRLTPRLAISLLESTIYIGGDVSKALDAMRILANGFTDRDLKILELVSQNESGIGEQAICAYIGTSKENYRYDIEPYLLKNGLILRTPRGRRITDSGIKSIQYLRRVQTQRGVK